MIKLFSIMIYLPNMGYGGVERVATNLCQYLLAQELHATLVLNEKKGERLSQIPRAAKVISSDRAQTFGTRPGLAHCLEREWPDILLSSLSQDSIIAIWAKCLAGVKTAIIIGQHNALSSESSGTLWQHRILPLLYLILSKNVADDMAARCGISRDWILVIDNQITTKGCVTGQACTHDWLADKDVPVFIGIGRLVPQKNFQLTIRAFAILSNRQQARLIIIGGPMRRKLQALASLSDVVDDMDLIGFRECPYLYLEQAAAVVLPSLFEGFGNVRGQAMSRGTPIISTDFPFGPSEIVADGHCGLLVSVDDPASMVDAMASTVARPRQSVAPMQRAVDFAKEAVGRQYLTLFDTATKRNETCYASS